MTQVAAPRTPRRISRLGALRIVNPKRWAKTVRKAMREADGHIPDAAAALDVSVRQLFRWLEDPLLACAKRAPSGTHRS